MTAQEIIDEHRECGKPKYDGCFSHVPLPHCRADGMALPCDVMRLSALAASQPPSGVVPAWEQMYREAAARVSQPPSGVAPDPLNAAYEDLLQEHAALRNAAQDVVTRWFDWIDGEASQTLRESMLRLRAVLDAPSEYLASGDAPDLREALRVFGERLAADGYGWEAIITRETPSGEQTVAHLTTANPDPATLAASQPPSGDRCPVCGKADCFDDDDPRCAWHDPGVAAADLRPRPCKHFPAPLDNSGHWNPDSGLSNVASQPPYGDARCTHRDLAGNEAHVVGCPQLNAHGYTCGFCAWGRDHVATRGEYEAHKAATGHVGEPPSGDAPEPTQEENARWYHMGRQRGLREALAASGDAPSGVCPACGLSWWPVGDDSYECNHGVASGDAPDLREDRTPEIICDCPCHLGNEVEHTPAPLEVERLARAIQTWEQNSFPEDESDLGAVLGVAVYEQSAREIASLIARAYANQEGGEPHEENA